MEFNKKSEGCVRVKKIYTFNIQTEELTWAAKHFPSSFHVRNIRAHDQAHIIALAVEKLISFRSHVWTTFTSSVWHADIWCGERNKPHREAGSTDTGRFILRLPFHTKLVACWSSFLFSSAAELLQANRGAVGQQHVRSWQTNVCA